MTHRNEAGTPPHGEDPLGLDPRPASVPSPPEDTPLTTGDPETPSSADDTPSAPRPSAEEDPLTGGLRDGRTPAEREDDPLTSGEFGDSVSSKKDEPFIPESFWLQGRPSGLEDDPLTGGESGGSVSSKKDEPFIPESFWLQGRPSGLGDDPLSTGELQGTASEAGAGDPLGSSGRDEDDAYRGNGSRGWYSGGLPWEDWGGGGVRWAAFHVPEEEPLAAPDPWERGTSGNDPLTTGEFGRRMASAASGGDPLEGRRPRRIVDPEDDPLTSSEFRVPRSAELEAMRAEAAAAEKAAAEKAAAEEAGREADDEAAEAPVADAAEPEAAEDGASAEDSGAEEAAEDGEGAEAREDAETGESAEAAEAAVEIAEVPEVPVAEPEEPEQPEERAGEVEFGRRLAALERLVELAEGRLDEELVAEASALLERAGERMRLSGEHTVVALAGGTGSGKSSLFNAVCGLELSPSGMRRPMTTSAHACVWGHDGAGPLLDWLGVDKRFRYARAGTPGRGGAEGEESLEGLVLIDLPDHDSIQEAHRAEVDRFVGVADLLVWVVDPQKYADAALHRDYIVPFARHAAVTLIVLNQVDRLQPAEVEDCVSDLRRLLESEGLADPHIITTSAVTEGGVDELRGVLARAVAAGNARADRLGADLDRVVERFAEHAEGGTVPVEIDERRAEGLVDALSAAAGVPAVAEAMESAYELRAADYVGWPFARWAGRLRRDPLRMIRLTELRDELRGAFSGPVGAQQGEIDNALHGITDGVAADVPESWRRSLRAVSRARAGELPDALGEALRRTAPPFNQVPRWWWLVRLWQLFLVVCALLGTVWLVLLVVYGVAGVAEAPTGLLDDTGILPWVLILTGCLFGMGALTDAACRNMVALSAARHGENVKTTMRESVAEVADELVLTPVAAELGALADFRSAVAEARR